MELLKLICLKSIATKEYLRSLGVSDCEASRSNMYCKDGCSGWDSSASAMFPCDSSSCGNPASHITCWLCSFLNKFFNNPPVKTFNAFVSLSSVLVMAGNRWKMDMTAPEWITLSGVLVLSCRFKLPVLAALLGLGEFCGDEELSCMTVWRLVAGESVLRCVRLGVLGLKQTNNYWTCPSQTTLFMLYNKTVKENYVYLKTWWI